MCCKRESPYIWVTWLSKIMAGEQTCLWASWFKTHFKDFKKAPSDFNMARWNLDHTRLLIRTRAELTARGAEIRVESQNSFQYRHAGGAIIAGKPDIVAIDGMEIVVVDCKTGKPKASDQLQVQIYMYVLPICFPKYGLYTIRGRLVYPDHSVEIAPAAVDSTFADHLDYFIDLVAGDKTQPQTPSVSECRFCDITSLDCQHRIDAS
jgi:CRISPR/Cas system-associated exonuclease Cas4 (RecB family)